MNAAQRAFLSALCDMHFLFGVGIVGGLLRLAGHDGRVLAGIGANLARTLQAMLGEAPT